MNEHIKKLCLFVIKKTKFAILLDCIVVHPTGTRHVSLFLNLKDNHRHLTLNIQEHKRSCRSTNKDEKWRSYVTRKIHHNDVWCLMSVLRHKRHCQVFLRKIRSSPVIHYSSVDPFQLNISKLSTGVMEPMAQKHASKDCSL